MLQKVCPDTRITIQLDSCKYTPSEDRCTGPAVFQIIISGLVHVHQGSASQILFDIILVLLRRKII